MRKSIIFALLLTIAAQGAWAEMIYYNPTRLGDGKCQFQGPWVFEDVGNAMEEKETKERSFNQLDRSSPSAVCSGTGCDEKITYQVNDNNGIGFTMNCKSSWWTRRYVVYSLYSHSESVPAYTRKRLTWNFILKGYTDNGSHDQTVALYARPTFDDMKNLAVDCTGEYSKGAGSQYLLARTTKLAGEAGNHESAITTKTFDFDNRDGATTQTKMWVLMLTHCIKNTIDYYVDVFQWGNFKDEGFSWQTFYYKHIFFNANGGKGTMEEQEIENSGTLTANAFTREHYTFAGWSTVQNGPIVYADGATITASEFDKGQRTLHAVWNRVDYGITYDLDGGTATNPTAYIEATETFTLNNPTRENCTFLGWTGSNGETPELEVTIPQGSEGDKTFVAHWIYTAAASAVSLIDAIGTVEHTAASKAKIDAARAAYDALSAEAKTDVPASKLETLRIAEATFAAAEPSTIRFMGQDGQTQVGQDQQGAIYYPTATGWQTVEKSASDKTIVIKAVQ